MRKSLWVSVRIETFVISTKIQTDYGPFPIANWKRAIIFIDTHLMGFSKHWIGLNEDWIREAPNPIPYDAECIVFLIHGTQFHLPVSTADHCSPTNRWPNIWWDSKMSPTHPMWGDRATNVATWMISLKSHDSANGTKREKYVFHWITQTALAQFQMKIGLQMEPFLILTWIICCWTVCELSTNSQIKPNNLELLSAHTEIHIIIVVIVVAAQNNTWKWDFETNGKKNKENKRGDQWKDAENLIATDYFGVYL